MSDSRHKVAENKSEIIAKLPLACADESAAVSLMEELRWKDTPICPRCSKDNIYQVKDRASGERNKDYRWRCRDCNKFYTVRTGTVMEESRIPLKHWCYAFWRASTSKKGASALEIKRHTGLSYKSALFLMHRIRYAMRYTSDDGTMLTGTVESDVTYVGGKPRNKGPHNKRGRGTKKTIVSAVVQRGGAARTQILPSVTADNVKKIIRDNVHFSSCVMTDDDGSYKGLHMEFDGGHGIIKHKAKEFAKGDITTNTVEGFFSLIKRGLYGVYHNVSKEHLHRYLSEFEFRYNTRKFEDGDRTATAIQGAVGKRLMYLNSIGGGI